MAKKTFTYYLEEKTASDLKRHADRDNRDASPFLDILLQKALYEMDCNLGFEQDNARQSSNEEGA